MCVLCIYTITLSISIICFIGKAGEGGEGGGKFSKFLKKKGGGGFIQIFPIKREGLVKW